MRTITRQDAYHQLVRSIAQQLNEPLISTLPVVTEVCYLLQKRVAQLWRPNFWLPKAKVYFQASQSNNNLWLVARY
jgi:hypothetical protein